MPAPHAEQDRYPLQWVTEGLAVGPAPMSFAQLSALKAEGVGAIMNLCAEFCDLHHLESGQGFEVYYMPVWDEEAPDLKELEKALAWLDEQLYLGKKVFIHCRHGIGRTGTVLNAYLLRRGLGHKEAARILKNLRSKPQNFEQWWTVRKYGRRSGRLTVREPSLTPGRIVDLGPFLADYQDLAKAVEERAAAAGVAGRCGREHVRCCHTPISLSFVEAVAVSQAINRRLSSEARLAAIERAVATARSERATQAGLEAAGRSCLSDAGAVCPLLDQEHCVIFDHRPLQCRTFELTPEAQAALWERELAPALAGLSRQVFLAYTAEFSPGEPPVFSLPDVVSGRWVERFFHALMA